MNTLLLFIVVNLYMTIQEHGETPLYCQHCLLNIYDISSIFFHIFKSFKTVSKQYYYQIIQSLWIYKFYEIKEN